MRTVTATRVTTRPASTTSVNVCSARRVTPPSSVDLLVASGSNLVPPVVGLDSGDAVAQVTGAGFEVEVHERVSDDDTAGIVIEMQPWPTTDQRLGSTVTLVVAASADSAPVRVADDTVTTPGSSSETIVVYLARRLRPVPVEERHERDGEELGMPTGWFPLDAVRTAILDGRLRNATLTVAVLAACGYDRVRHRGRPVDPAVVAREPLARIVCESSGRG